MKLIDEKKFLKELEKESGFDGLGHITVCMADIYSGFSKHLKDLPKKKSTHPVNLEDVDEDSESGVLRALIKTRGYNQCLKDCEGKKLKS